MNCKPAMACYRCKATTVEECMCTPSRQLSGLMAEIHASDPYENYRTRPEDLQGWGGHPEFFKRMIELTAPETIVEVGTWKGRSAIAMAKILDEIEREIISPESTRSYWCEDTKIVCVDTWLGATEFWTDQNDEKRYKSLKLQNGYPTVYHTFLSNVLHNNAERRIIPFPQTSTNAARFFKKKGLKAQLIYIDASHEYDDVMMDLRLWRPILDEGGIMFGDDYCDYWRGVKDAVDRFAMQKNNLLTVQTRRYENPNGQAPSDYWVLSKDGVKLP